MNDKDVVDAFVGYLRKHGYPDLKVDERPDERNRKSSDIDAIAGPFAIEHTSIDTLPHQRRDTDWFMRVAGKIEQEITEKLPFRLNVILEYDALNKKQDWPFIRRNLISWITSEVPLLKDGSHVLEEIPGVPFRLHIVKASNRPPGVIVARFKPEDNTLSKRVRKQLDRKAEKLVKYYHSKTTILLVENDDIALMNEIKMREAIQKAYPKGLPYGVNEIWYADTSISSSIEFKDLTPTINSQVVPSDY